MFECSYACVLREVERYRDGELAKIKRLLRAPNKCGSSSCLERVAEAVRRLATRHGTHISIDGMHVSVSAAPGGFGGLRALDMVELKKLLVRLRDDAYTDFAQMVGMAINQAVQVERLSNPRGFSGFD